MRRRRRFTAPQCDSTGEEEEGVAADLFHRFDLLGGVPNGGDGRGTVAGRRGPTELGLGFGGGNNWEEWYEEEQVGVVLACLASEGAGSACVSEATWRHGASAHCGDRDDDSSVLPA